MPVASLIPCWTTHHSPVGREEEHVMVELIAVLHRGAVDLRGGPARVDERPRVAPEPFADLGDLLRCLARRRALAAGREETELALDVLEAFLHRAAHRRGHAARVPVEAEHAAERLEPERIGEAAQHLVRAVLG